MRLRAVLLGLGLLGLSCARDDRAAAEREDQKASLGGEVAARVGNQTIPLSIVESVAGSQRVSAREAAKKVVDDEVAASAAHTRGLDRAQPAAWRLVSARARFLSDRLFEDAKRQGPPTDEEVKLLSEKHWAEVDRPPCVRVIHAIVLRPKDAALEGQARSLGNELREAVLTTTDPDDFEEKAKAKAVTHDAKLEVRVENLPPFTDDGWIIGGGGRMNEVFSKAAFALASPGATSTVIETPFGWHVIRLIERLPEKRMPIETRRVAFTEEVYSLRARDLLNARLKTLRGANEVRIAPAAEQLMRSVTFSAPEAVGTP